jgi:hypothetical protein
MNVTLKRGATCNVQSHTAGVVDIDDKGGGFVVVHVC